MAESAHGVAPDGMKKRDEDSDDGMEFSPFWGIEKGAVLQEARCFNESQLDARRCQQVITKLLYLLNQGETFTKVRARRDDRDERVSGLRAGHRAARARQARGRARVTAGAPHQRARTRQARHRTARTPSRVAQRETVERHLSISRADTDESRVFFFVCTYR